MGSSHPQINSAEQVLQSGAKTRSLDCSLGHSGHREHTGEKETIGKMSKMQVLS